LQADRDHKDAIWREVIARCRTLFPAHSARLQILAKKWGGSHEEMFEFDAAPTGDPLAAMVPLAHFEVMLDRVDEAIEKGNKYIPAGGGEVCPEAGQAVALTTVPRAPSLG
jgi:hypothetical protein